MILFNLQNKKNKVYKQNLCLYKSFSFEYSGAPLTGYSLRNHIDSLYSCSSSSES
jgi:hypothetical protein